MQMLRSALFLLFTMGAVVWAVCLLATHHPSAYKLHWLFVLLLAWIAFWLGRKIWMTKR